MPHCRSHRMVMELGFAALLSVIWRSKSCALKQNARFVRLPSKTFVEMIIIGLSSTTYILLQRDRCTSGG